MSEEDVDNHVLRKYSLLQKLGKGVRLLLLPWHSFALAGYTAAHARAPAGLRSGVESSGQEKPEPSGPEEDF
jgi:hypothetical protein